MATVKDQSFDLARALAGIAPPLERVEISAGFFHRTLARWLGLPEGRQPGKRMATAPLWDYDFWKAELIDDGADATGRHSYTAKVFRVLDSQPEPHRYWIKFDGAGRIRRSGWFSTAPDLLDAPRAAPPSPVITAGDLARIFRDDP